MSDDLRRETIDILADIPEAFVRLHVAVTAPRRKRSSGVKVSGGTRDFVPLNTEAEAHIAEMRATVFHVHATVTERFGEPRQAAGIQPACDDLARWSDIWTRLPDAEELVDKLRATLDRANKITGYSEEPTRMPQHVCPNCLSIGGLYVGDDDGVGCDGCGTTWDRDDYQQAVRDVLAAFRPAA